MIDLPLFWIDDSDKFTECCDHIAAHRIVALDTEFIGESTYHPQLCLVQIATPERLVIIDPFAAGPIDRFWGLLSDPERSVVVHAGREEIRICVQGCGRAPEQIFDVQIAAGLAGVGYPLSYAGLVQQVLQAPLAKGETLSDWSRRPLTAQQVQYAYDDVRFLLPLHAHLSERLTELGRQRWLAEEAAALIRHALFDGPEFERWRKLRGVGSLDRKRLAMVRELYAWRETLAERQNRPARTLLRDDLLVEIARRSPRHERDLGAFRGIPSREYSAILAAIQRARELPPEQWPLAAEREVEIPTVTLLASFLNAVLADLCARWSLAQSLVATTSDVKRFVRARFEDKPELLTDSALGAGWRAEFVAPVLRSVLSGERGLRVGGLHRPAPLDWGEAGPPPLPNVGGIDR